MLFMFAQSGLILTTVVTCCRDCRHSAFQWACLYGKHDWVNSKVQELLDFTAGIFIFYAAT